MKAWLRAPLMVTKFVSPKRAGSDEPPSGGIFSRLVSGRIGPPPPLAGFTRERKNLLQNFFNEVMFLLHVKMS
jgi:hypothetical protein